MSILRTMTINFSNRENAIHLTGDEVAEVWEGLEDAHILKNKWIVISQKERDGQKQVRVAIDQIQTVTMIEQEVPEPKKRGGLVNWNDTEKEVWKNGKI
ncbi:hypothetical protein [Listeria ilorinensis]|uniref:hypothetical protein n=1 Tax=Listeria ilorinensis TaxID=2867439 RepID=UPI001EF6B970|nr:hypothetical protein [Listeria ilorinensis]